MARINLYQGTDVVEITRKTSDGSDKDRRNRNECMYRVVIEGVIKIDTQRYNDSKIII